MVIKNDDFYYDYQELNIILNIIFDIIYKYMSNFNDSDNYYSIIMNNISTLQTKEQQLYSDLNKYGISDDSKNKIIADINNLSKERIELYNILETNSMFMQNLVNSAENDLKNQKFTLEIIENELSDIKKQYNNIKNNHISKLRMVEINTYYSKKYKAYSDIMKTIILFCVPILLLAILSKINLIPQNISFGVSSLISIIGGIYIGMQIYNLSIRNNMDYDQIDFPFDAEQQNKEDSGSSENISQVLDHEFKDLTSSLKNKLNMGCIGSECCSKGMSYDKQLKKCVDDKHK